MSSSSHTLLQMQYSGFQGFVAPSESGTRLHSSQLSDILQKFFTNNSGQLGTTCQTSDEVDNLRNLESHLDSVILEVVDSRYGVSVASTRPPDLSDGDQDEGGGGAQAQQTLQFVQQEKMLPSDSQQVNKIGSDMMNKGVKILAAYGRL